MPRNKPVIYIDDEEVELPTKWVICHTCRGEGKSSAYLGAFTREDMDEDPDFAEEYMHGRYDRACETCDGTGKVAVVDRCRCTREEYETYQEQQAGFREVDHMYEMERRMGA